MRTIEERHHCEYCGDELDNGHEQGPLGDYSYLCQPCERKIRTLMSAAEDTNRRMEYLGWRKKRKKKGTKE